MRIVRSLDAEFAQLHERSLALVGAVAPDKLYWQPRVSAHRVSVYSCGEHILRSAATVEQTFGGINVNLWDDPFEWTLPETLPTPGHVIAYLREAEETRLRSFALFKFDADLLKEIAAPANQMRTLFSLITETLVRAAQYQGRAFATFRLFSDERV